MGRTTSDPAGYLPLSEQVFQILLSLTDSELHGYAMIRDVEDRTQGAIRLSASTLYSALKRMLRDGLIQESGDRPAPDADDERRRYYRITPLGVAVARLEALRIERLASMARAKRLLADR